MTQPTILSRYQGSLLGLAIGDALGAPLEFCPPGRFPPITGFSGGGKFKTAPGEWTDDTAMALCLGESPPARYVTCARSPPRGRTHTAAPPA